MVQRFDQSDVLGQKGAQHGQAVNDASGPARVIYKNVPVRRIRDVTAGNLGPDITDRLFDADHKTRWIHQIRHRPFVIKSPAKPPRRLQQDFRAAQSALRRAVFVYNSN